MELLIILEIRLGFLEKECVSKYLGFASVIRPSLTDFQIYLISENCFRSLNGARQSVCFELN